MVQRKAGNNLIFKAPDRALFFCEVFMRYHSGIQKWKEIQTMTSEHNMFVLERSDGYIVYRKTEKGNVRLGRRRYIDDLHKFVKKLAGI
jgi:hypothetical protein